MFGKARVEATYANFDQTLKESPKKKINSEKCTLT